MHAMRQEMGLGILVGRLRASVVAKGTWRVYSEARKGKIIDDLTMLLANARRGC
jgi:hypothetical protein